MSMRNRASKYDLPHVSKTKKLEDLVDKKKFNHLKTLEWYKRSFVNNNFNCAYK